MVAQTRRGGGPSRKSSIGEKLIGKGLSTNALLEKLKALHTELAEIDQEGVDTSSLDPVCKEITNQLILQHDDEGVRAYTACCLADLLRLYAPDAPFNPNELKNIFQFFLRQLTTGLSGPEAPYYTEYFHLLESLSTVKSVVLVCDVPQADKLIVKIFRGFFELVKNNLAKNIEIFMADILTALIDESQTLPQDVLEIVMAQFTDKNARMDQPAYRLAVELCNATSDTLRRHVCQYFTDIIVQYAEDQDYDQVRVAHDLIKRLNHSCPALLHNVIPQLEEELKVEEVQLRQIATQILGDMFADRGGNDLEKKYPSTWNLWLSRKNDKSTTVRLAFVEGCKGLLQHHHSELRQVVEDVLDSKLQDPDEKVRAAVCRLYGQLDYETAVHYVSRKQLENIGLRTLDKKQSVRQEALLALGKLFNTAFNDIESNDAAAIEHFSWIPNQILHAVTATMEVRTIVEEVLAEHILPLPSKGDEELAWSERLLMCMGYMDEKARSLLVSISGVKLSRPTVYERYLQCCIENNGGIIDENEEIVKRKLTTVVKLVASQYPDPQKAAEDLQTFAKMNEQRLYKLLKTCLDPQTDLKGLSKATNEFTRRLEQHSSIVSTMKALIRHGGFWIFNHASIPTFLKLVEMMSSKPSKRENGASPETSAGIPYEILITMCKSCPAMFKTHVSELLKAIAEEKNPFYSEICLQALDAVARQEPGVIPKDSKTMDRIKKYIKGPNHRFSKFSARILASVKQADACEEIVNNISENIQDADPETLTCYVAVLAEYVECAPDAFESHSEEIMKFLMKDVLLPGYSEDSMEVDEGVDWQEDEDLPPRARTKVLAIKVCRRRCLAQSGTESAHVIAGPVIRMLLSVLDNGGTLVPEVNEMEPVKSRMRLQAAWSLVQLATVDKFSEEIVPNFLTVAWVMQDPCFQVRLLFITKVITLLQQRKLHPRFNVIPFLAVHDPEDEIREKVQGYVKSTFTRMPPDARLNHFEMIFIRLLHAIAHHPDFGTTEAQLFESSKYIDFYLDLIASTENVSLLYHLAMRAKSVRDAESDAYSENLYVASELAQALIRKRAKSYTAGLTSYPGKVKLPPELFRSLPSAETAKTVMQTQYLSDDIITSLENAKAAKEKARPDPRSSPKRKTKRGRTGGAKRAKTAVQRRRGASDDESDVDSGDSDSDNNSDEEGTNPPPAPASDSDGGEVGGEDEGDGAEELGRGARTRAKAKAKRKARKAGAGKSKAAINS